MVHEAEYDEDAAEGEDRQVGRSFWYSHGTEGSRHAKKRNMDIFSDIFSVEGIRLTTEGWTGNKRVSLDQQAEFRDYSGNNFVCCHRSGIPPSKFD